MNQNTADEALHGTACIITGGLLDTRHAKTAHGLMRESYRFDILGVIDEKFSGRDAGEILDGKVRGLPVVATVRELIEKIGQKPQFAVLGMATKGGVLPDNLYPVVQEALSLGIHVVNGLHQPLSEVEALQQVAAENGALIYDVRKPKNFKDMHFWSGKILEVDCLKVGILGTDCATGKRTTARMLSKALNDAGVRAEMIFTGQTGWLQGLKYGFIFDATPNDFIPGEIEYAIHSCWKKEQPKVIIVEGQASLLNPGGPCGAEFIIAGRLDGVILQHHPVRERYNNLEYFPAIIPDVLKDREIIELLGAETWAITLNTEKMSDQQIRESREDIASRSGLPVLCPVKEGVAGLVAVIKAKLEK